MSRQELAVAASGGVLVLASLHPGARSWLGHPDINSAGIGAVVAALALWLGMAMPLVLTSAGGHTVSRATLTARWGLGGTLLLAADSAGHAIADAVPGAWAAPGLVVLGIGGVPLVRAARGRGDLPAPHAWPMAAMHFAGMANPVNGLAITASMTLACAAGRARLATSSLLLIGLAVRLLASTGTT